MSKRRKTKPPSKPTIIILAGPNGAGKTTFAAEYLPNEAACTDFINADLIAKGLSPFYPEAVALEAGRVMLKAIDERVALRKSFAFETTLAGRTYAAKIRSWRKWGYVVNLYFLMLPSADVAVARVAGRVMQGGHNVPESDIRRRFALGIRNFRSIYSKLVNNWKVYDSSASPPAMISEGTNDVA